MIVYNYFKTLRLWDKYIFIWFKKNFPSYIFCYICKNVAEKPVKFAKKKPPDIKIIYYYISSFFSIYYRVKIKKILIIIVNNNIITFSKIITKSDRILFHEQLSKIVNAWDICGKKNRKFYDS